MRVLITGASGFVGEGVLNKVLNHGPHQILSIGRNSISSKLLEQNNVDWIQASLKDSHHCNKLVEEFKPEALIHLAWDGIPDFSFEKCQENLMISTNFIRNVFAKTKLKKVLVSGSCFEYSNRTGECFEKDPTYAVDYFTWSKLSLLNFIRCEAENLSIDWAWLRIFYAYGKGQREGSLIPMLVENLKKGSIPNIKTPLNKNDFIHIDDVAEAFAMSLDRNFSSGIYNLGCGNPVSVLEVCRTVEFLVSGKSELTDILKERTSELKNHTSFYANTILSREQLGWEAQITLKSGIIKLLDE